jgi:hypothetical protein
MDKIKFYTTSIFLLIVFSFSQTLGASPVIRGGRELPVGKSIPITGNTEQLKYFFNALEKTNSQKIRIGHYGDSNIWGDVNTFI